MEDFGKSFGESVLCTSTPMVSKSKIDKNIGFRFTGLKENDNIISLDVWNNNEDASGKDGDGQVCVIDQCSLSNFGGHSSDKHILNTNDLDPIVVEAYQKYMLSSQRNASGSGNVEKFKQQQASDVYYLFFDEHVFQTMVNMGWSRTSEIVKMLPVACGFYEHWLKQTQNIKDKGGID
jgi:hypothetical protein